MMCSNEMGEMGELYFEQIERALVSFAKTGAGSGKDVALLATRDLD